MTGTRLTKQGQLVSSIATVLTIVLVMASCGGGESAPPASLDTVPLVSPTTLAVTTSSTTTTSTTAPDPEPDGIEITDVIELPNLTIHIDPRVLDLDETAAVVDTLNKVLTSLPLQFPADAVLYGSSEESIDWAFETTRELNCLHSEDRVVYTYFGQGATCGFIMKVDAMPIDCYGNEPPCTNALKLAGHEFFHTITDQRVTECVCEPLIFGKKIPNWYAEGIADYVGYQTAFGGDPSWLTKILDSELSRANDPNIAVGIIEMEALWGRGPVEPWFEFLYDRSFFAAALLVEQFGDSAVLDTIFDEVLKAGNFSRGFEATFGKTEEQFSDEFLAWIAAL